MSRKFQARRRGFLQVLIGAAFTAFGSGALNAQTFNINNGAGSWNANANWTPATFPNGVGASATFGAVTAASTVSLNSAMTVGSLNFTQTSSTNGHIRSISNGTGGSLVFDAVGTGEATITVNGTSTLTNNVTIVASTILNDTLRFTNNNVSGTGSATATITGTLTGAGGFIKDGAGRFSFSTAAKTYTGATVVNQGRLRMTGSGQTTGTSSITVNSGGSLYLDSTSQAWSLGSGLVTINGDGDNGGGTGTQGALRNQGSGTNTLSNAVALGSNATIHVDGSSILQLNGGLTGSSTLTKSGSGTLQFTTTNSGLASNLLVQSGTILVNSASRIGSGSLTLAQTAGSSTSVTLNNSLQTVSSLSSSWVDTTGTLSQTITLNGTALTVNQVTNGTYGNGAVDTLTSTIAGTGSLIKSGDAALTLTSANTYSGSTLVTAGTLNVQNTLATSGVTVSGGTLNLSALGTLGTGTVTSSGGTIDLGAKSITNTLGALTGGGAVNNGTVTNNSGTYNVQSGSVGAVLAGTNGLTKSTGGTVTLSGANTYTGGTTVNDGALNVTSTGSLASGSALTISSSGTADFANAGQTLGAVSNANTLADALNFSANSGTVTFASLSGVGNTRFGSIGTVTGGISSGTVTSVGALNADISGTANVTAGGLLTGTISAGTVSAGSLSSTSVTGGTNDIAGAANIATLNGGVTTVNGVAAIGTMTSGAANLFGTTSTITTLNGGSVNLTGTALTVSGGTTSGAITGTGSLVKDSGGVLTLSGASSYTGTTNVTAGTLVVNGNNSAATGAVTVSSGATLGGTGTIGGATTIAGVHNPGNSPGIQTFGSDLTYSGGASVNWELIGNTATNTANPTATFDSIVVGGNLNFSGSTLLNLNFASAGSGVLWADAFWDSSKTGANGWLLYNVASSTTNFGNFNIAALNWTDSAGNAFNTERSGASFGLAQSGNGIYLNYTISAVPEPSSVILLTSSVVVFAYLRRRRKRNKSRV